MMQSQSTMVANIAQSEVYSAASTNNQLRLISAFLPPSVPGKSQAFPGLFESLNLRLPCILNVCLQVARSTFQAMGSNSKVGVARSLAKGSTSPSPKGKVFMNRTFISEQANLANPERSQQEHVHAITGMLWASMLGSAFWLTVLALTLNS